MFRTFLLSLVLGCSRPPDPCTDEGNRVGECAPDFTLGRANGGEWTLSEHEGSVVLVQFAAGWCGICQVTAESEQVLVDDYRSDGFIKVTILKANTQYQPPDEGDALEWKEAFGLDHPVLYDQDKSVWKEWKHKTSTVPQQFLVDRGGSIRWRWVGLSDEETLREEIEEYLSYD